MKSPEELFTEHTSALLDRVDAINKEAAVMHSFDTMHTSHMAPREPRECAPGDHEPTMPTIRADDLPNIVIRVDCENCHATGYRTLDAEDFEEWEL